MVDLQDIRIGVALTGSHCTLDSMLSRIKELKKAGAELLPIVSPAVRKTDTRFGSADSWMNMLQEITGKVPWATIVEVEPIGPQGLLDLLLIAPCTGNTMAKLANGVVDSTVLMAAKAHLRNGRPLLLHISTNDGLGLNARNLVTLINTKNVYAVPFGQDDPVKKPNSLVSKQELILPAVFEALQGKQLQPILVSYT